MVFWLALFWLLHCPSYAENNFINIILKWEKFTVLYCTVLFFPKLYCTDMTITSPYRHDYYCTVQPWLLLYFTELYCTAMTINAPYSHNYHYILQPWLSLHCTTRIILYLKLLKTNVNNWTIWSRSIYFLFIFKDMFLS